MERSEERRGTRQVALGLCDIRLECDDIHVVGCDIKNLIKPFAAPRENDAETHRKPRAR